jgi:hypothetical protein
MHNTFVGAAESILGAASVQRTCCLAILGVFTTFGNGMAVTGTAFATVNSPVAAVSRLWKLIQ